MELIKIEQLLEKYFQAETNSVEENKLRVYFNSESIAPELKQYQKMFTYFDISKTETLEKEINFQSKKSASNWMYIAASIVLLIGSGIFFLNRDTSEKIDCNNPDIAFRETQKALQMLSENVNVGIESVTYVQEFETTKNRVFKK